MHRLRALFGLVLLLPSAASARAQVTVARASRVTLPVRRDSTGLPAPWVSRGDLLVLGSGAVAALLAQRADLAVRNEVRSGGWQENGALQSLERVGDRWGGQLALIGSIGLWTGGAWARDRDVAAIGFRAYESIVVSGVITKALKLGFGRARPRVDSLDAWNVEAGRGTDNDHESFPSGHATAAFAFAAAVTSEVAARAPRHAVLVGATTFTLAGVTAWSRLHADAHWLSDVTMGAAIGMASGWAVARWHRTRPDNWFDRMLLPRAVSPFIAPGPAGGTTIGASFAWR